MEAVIVARLSQTRRSEIALAIPQEEHLKMVRDTLLSYFGRVAVVMKNAPNISILATVACSRYFPRDECVMVRAVVRGRKSLKIFFFLEDIRNYYLFGSLDLAQQMSMSGGGEDCPSLVRLLD